MKWSEIQSSTFIYGFRSNVFKENKNGYRMTKLETKNSTYEKSDCENYYISSKRLRKQLLNEKERHGINPWT